MQTSRKSSYENNICPQLLDGQDP